MACKLPTMESFGATGLIARSTAAVTSKTPSSAEKRVHREDVVEPAHERAVGHQWLDLVRLEVGELQSADPADDNETRPYRPRKLAIESIVEKLQNPVGFRTALEHSHVAVLP